MKIKMQQLLLVFLLVPISCWSQVKKDNTVPENSPANQLGSARAKSNKDQSLDSLIRVLQQADSIHRESWWVLTEDRRPPGKSPFGKVQRALMSSQNSKLTNKSLFRCDRYFVQRTFSNAGSYPQDFEVFEKCSEKAEAKKLALIHLPDSLQVELSFFPENLEEVLGLGAAVLNKPITCAFKIDKRGSLLTLNCKDWSQDKTKEQMIRLDTYEFSRGDNSLIKLRGKVFENLRDIRKIIADVPLEGKVEVVETELYAQPEEKPKPLRTITPLPSSRPVSKDLDNQPQQQLQIPPSRESDETKPLTEEVPHGR